MDKDEQMKPEQVAVRGLRKATELHNAENYDALRRMFDETSSEISEEHTSREINIGLAFMDSWGDSSGHDWFYYEGIEKDDWPRMAEEIIEAIESGKEITNAKIIKHFDLPPRTSVWRRIKGIFRQGG